jgi:glycosyltransferase involved in cell wall biosynthesis
MRVLVLTNMYPTADEPWVGCFVRDQVEDLRALGLEVEVLHIDGRRSSAAYARGVQRLRDRVGVVPFDIVHAHYGLTGAVALTQRRAPVVTTFHGGDYTGEVWWQAPISWVVARRSTPIFVSAEGTRRLRLFDAAVIPAPVDTVRFRPGDRREARRRLGWKDDRRYALFPSSPRHGNKRVDLFDAALAAAREIETRLEPVYLQGFGRDEVAEVMNAVDVTVLTSNFEGSPVTVRESLASATPVVSVDVGDVASVVANLPGCAIAPREPEAIARAILAALASDRPPELRQRAEETAREAVARRVVTVYELAAGAAIASRR